MVKKSPEELRADELGTRQIRRLIFFLTCASKMGQMRIPPPLKIYRPPLKIFRVPRVMAGMRYTLLQAALNLLD
jgi:hypothetical protein